MKKLTETLRKKQTGYGHFQVSIVMNGQDHYYRHNGNRCCF